MIVRLGRLFIRMLRYRAAVMIWMFLLLGAASGGDASRVGLDHLLAFVALAASYVCATTVNDIADRDIDGINHPGDPGRPLVTGEATVRDLWIINLSSACLALGTAIAISPSAAGFIALGLVVAYIYSAPPFRVSYRTYLAPLLLSVGYVIVPFMLGAELAHDETVTTRAMFMTGLVGLFVARIVLKDFRDRAGDLTHGRPTLLLRWGQGVTCLCSLVALGIGDAALIGVLHAPPTVVVVLQVFVAAIIVMLNQLLHAEDVRSEQIAIGIGARMGNGLLLSVLAWLLLEHAGAPPTHQLLFVILLATAYGANFVTLRSNPQEVLLGYKG